MELNTNDKHSTALDAVLEKLREQGIDAHREEKTGLGYDIYLNDSRKLIVVKMKYNKDRKPFCAVSLTKWKFAVENPSNVAFVIAYENEMGKYEVYYYSVEEFWEITSEPGCDLYCHLDTKQKKTSLDDIKKASKFKRIGSISKCIKSISKMKDTYRTLKKLSK